MRLFYTKKDIYKVEKEYQILYNADKLSNSHKCGKNTDFYKNSRDYVSEEKQKTFMNPADVAKTILGNVLSEANLTVADIIIERN